MRFLSLGVLALVLSSAQASSFPCKKVLRFEEQIGPEAIVQIKSTARTGPGLGHDDGPGLLVYKGPNIGMDGSSISAPSSRLRVIRGPWRINGEVNVVLVELIDDENKSQGYVYWCDLRKNMVILTAASAQKTKKPEKPKFPNKFSPTEYGPHKTYYGSTFPKVGDLIWAGSPNRVLSLKPIGKVKEIRGTFIEYESLEGKTEMSDIHYSA